MPATIQRQAVETGIQLRDLRKSFEGRKVLDGLTLEVRKAELTSVIGRSGAGKSVLLKHIVGLMKADSGRVLVDGVDIAVASRRDVERVRDRIGYLFQGAALLNSMTVFDNVALPLRERARLGEPEVRAEVAAALEKVGLPCEAEKFPAELSGGMRKRVGLARAIVGHRDIFLYDEPTAGLDPIAAATIRELIRKIQGSVRAASIVVSHDLSFVFAISDRIAMLHEGRIHAIGTPEEIRSSQDPVVRDFLEGRPSALTECPPEGGAQTSRAAAER
jgi:phospholipid/cholesterol/gamma-HCH transport system ATP-binding protein